MEDLHTSLQHCKESIRVLQQEALSSEGSGPAQPAQAAQWWQTTGGIVGMSVSAALVLGLGAGAVAYSL